MIYYAQPWTIVPVFVIPMAAAAFVVYGRCQVRSEVENGEDKGRGIVITVGRLWGLHIEFRVGILCLTRIFGLVASNPEIFFEIGLATL